jgi:tetratricopeptide (TPR) repeat protein
MSRCCLLLLLLATSIWGQQKDITISGKVTDGKNPIPDVNITVAHSETGTRTDVMGSYGITVNEGARLIYSHIGYESVELVVESVDQTLDIVMVQKVNQLDNVSVADTRLRKTQKDLFNEYNDNPNLIKTKFGILDKETSGTALYIKDGETFNKAELNILEVISNSFPSVRISPRGNKFIQTSPQDPNAVIYVRGINALTPAVYEVDGVLFTEPPLFLDVGQIERLAFKPGVVGIVRYGTIANGGLFIINTKTGNFSPEKGKGNKKMDVGKIKDIGLNNPISQKQVLKNAPSYLLEISGTKTNGEAHMVHNKYYKRYSNSLEYILDITQYFLSAWKDISFTDSLIAVHRDMFVDNIASLKALAYIYESQNYKERANETYKKILKLRPKETESYMNLANSYYDLGNVKKAVSIYARYQYLIDNSILSLNEDFHEIFTKDREVFLAKTNSQNISRSNRNQLVDKTETKNVRLIFQYNNKEADFQLQFVNPIKNSFEIDYTDFSASTDSKGDNPMTTTEFLIDESIRGLWQVNAKYFGNKSLTPTYIKVTIYHNYGSASQRKETKLFKLSLRNVNQQLFTVSNMASVVSK